MKKIVYSLAALVILAACQKEKELVIADHGPTQTITYDQEALMGSVVNFSVNLQDDIALSTVKVALLFDETVVADTTNVSTHKANANNNASIILISLTYNL